MKDIEQLFEKKFGASSCAFTVRAPGRVNLIGEHIDYNDGFVLPMALPLSVLLRVRPRDDRKVILFAANFDERREFDLDEIEKQNNWIDYVQGVAAQLLKLDLPLRGFEGVVSSDVPVASGLSSSAAIEVAAALAFSQAEQYSLSKKEIALLCQRAENEFLQVNCGIMDQMAVAACEKDHALLLDCRSLEIEQVPLKLQDHAIVITDSAAPRTLAGSAYNERRAQCEEAARILRETDPQIQSLRDVSLEALERAALPEIVFRRARHVVSEIERTIEAARALHADDLETFGALMNASHQSLADDYEVSSAELDWLTNWARARPGVLGSRLTGAGFGGCTVTLLEREAAGEFFALLPKEYEAATGRAARCWICTAQNGAEVL